MGYGRLLRFIFTKPLKRPYIKLRSTSFCRVSLHEFSENSLDILGFNLGVDGIADYCDRSKGACSYATHSLQGEEAVFTCSAYVTTKLFLQLLHAISCAFHV